MLVIPPLLILPMVAADPLIEPTKRPIVEAPWESRRFLQAGPGTGKTFCLIERIKHLVEHQELRAGSEILILSFSVAAVAEVKKRVAELSSNSDEMSDLPFVEVRTFDSFATRLLKKIGNEDTLKGKSYEERIEMATLALQDEEAASDVLGDLKHLMVDEVQDLVGSRACMTLELLKQIGCQGAGFTLFGDIAQGIYDFQLEGEKEQLTSVEFLEFVRADFPDIDESISLDINFRVSGSDKLERIANQGRRQILENIPRGASYLFGEFDQLDSLGSLLDFNLPSDDLAILCRDNGQVLRLASHLQKMQSSFFIPSKKDSRFIPPWLGMMLREAKGRLLRKSEVLESYKQRLRPWFPSFEDCWRDLMRYGRSRSSRNSLDLSLLRQALIEGAAFSRVEEANNNKVILSTIHRSKGREYDDVAVVMSDGVRPEEAIDCDEPVVDEDVIGETKVLFVALTRAKKSLFRMEEGARDGLRLAAPKKERWVEMPIRSSQFGVYNQFRSLEVGLEGDLEAHSFVSYEVHGHDLEQVSRNQAFIEELSFGDPASLRFSRMAEGCPVFSVLIHSGESTKVIGETSSKFGRDFFNQIGAATSASRKFPHEVTDLWVAEVVTEIGESGRVDVPRSMQSFPVWLGVRLQGLGRCGDWRPI